MSRPMFSSLWKAFCGRSRISQREVLKNKPIWHFRKKLYEKWKDLDRDRARVLSAPLDPTMGFEMFIDMIGQSDFCGLLHSIGEIWPEEALHLFTCLTVVSSVSWVTRTIVAIYEILTCSSISTRWAQAFIQFYENGKKRIESPS